MSTDRTPNPSEQQPRKTLRQLKRLARVDIADAVAITALRLKVFQNGYPPIPAHDKRSMFTGWNTVEVTPAVINEWLHPRVSRTPYPGTGIRVEGGLLTIDLDIPHQEMVRDMRAAIMTIAPEIFEARGALERGRDDGSAKCMFFLRRTGDPFTIRSKKWTSVPGDPDAPEFRIEIFASERNPEGRVRRQVGAFGPHTVDEDSGQVKVNYVWKGRSPADVPLEELPAIDEEQARAIALELDRLAVAYELVVVPGYASGRVDPIDVYDLVEEMEFEGADFGPVNLSGLVEIYWQNEAMPAETRCSGSFTGEGGTRKDRCHVGWSGSRENGHITIHDYATDITHRPVIVEPLAPEGLSGALSKIAELFRSPTEDDPDPAAPTFHDRLHAAIGEMEAGDFSEDAFALALVGLYGEKLCFDPFEKQWLRFAGPCWEPETTARIESVMVGPFCSAVRTPRTPAGMRLRQRLRSHRHCASVEKKLRGMLEYKGGFDRDPYLAAGVTVAVELKTGLARPGKPEDRLRKSWLCDPAAEEDCPLWSKFLGQVTLGDQGLQRFLQQWAGMGLCGDPTHQKLAFFYGGGWNGKNTYVDVLRRISSDYGYESDLGAFMAQRYEQHSTGLWALKGKRMVVASEVAKGATWDEVKIKALTGNEAMTARAMRENFETFPRTWTITIIGNHQPKLKDVDAATRRRIRMVPFDLDLEATPEKVDLELPMKLVGEAPGILRWMLNGFLDVRQNGLSEPVRVKEETAIYFAAEDRTALFVQDRLEIGGQGEIDHRDMFRSWTAYAVGCGVDPGNPRGLSVRLRKLLKTEPVRKTHGVVWEGLRLRPLRWGFET